MSNSVSQKKVICKEMFQFTKEEVIKYPKSSITDLKVGTVLGLFEHKGLEYLVCYNDGLSIFPVFDTYVVSDCLNSDLLTYHYNINIITGRYYVPLRYTTNSKESSQSFTAMLDRVKAEAISCGNIFNQSLKV